MNKRYLYLFLAIKILLFLSTDAWSRVVKLRRMNLNIIFQVEQRGKKSEKQWKNLCRYFGDRLLEGKGIWGLGMVRRYGCRVGEKTIFNKFYRHQFNLTFEQQPEKFLVKIDWKPKGLDEEVMLFSQVIDSRDPILEYFRDPQNAELLLLTLMEKLPAAAKSILRGDQEKWKMVGKKRRKGAQLSIKPPLTLDLFQLSYHASSKSWRRQNLGTGVLENKDDFLKEGYRPVWIVEAAKGVAFKDSLLCNGDFSTTPNFEHTEAPAWMPFLNS